MHYRRRIFRNANHDRRRLERQAGVRRMLEHNLRQRPIRLFKPLGTQEVMMKIQYEANVRFLITKELTPAHLLMSTKERRRMFKDDLKAINERLSQLKEHDEDVVALSPRTFEYLLGISPDPTQWPEYLMPRCLHDIFVIFDSFHYTLRTVQVIRSHINGNNEA